MRLFFYLYWSFCLCNFCNHTQFYVLKYCFLSNTVITGCFYETGILIKTIMKQILLLVMTLLW